MSLFPEAQPVQPGLPSNPLGTFSNNLAGAYMKIFSDAASSTDPFAKMFAMQQMQNMYNSDPERMREQLKVVSEYEDERAKKAQAMGMQSTIFGGLVKTLADTPKQIAAARQMYGPEASTNFVRGMQAFGNTSQPPRYF